MYEELMTLRQHRERKMLTIRSLASMAKVSTQTVVKIERGDRVRPSTVGKIAKALGVNPEDIREFMRIVMVEE